MKDGHPKARLLEALRRRRAERLSQARVRLARAQEELARRRAAREARQAVLSELEDAHAAAGIERTARVVSAGDLARRAECRSKRAARIREARRALAQSRVAEAEAEAADRRARREVGQAHAWLKAVENAQKRLSAEAARRAERVEEWDIEDHVAYRRSAALIHHRSES